MNFVLSFYILIVFSLQCCATNLQFIFFECHSSMLNLLFFFYDYKRHFHQPFTNWLISKEQVFDKDIGQDKKLGTAKLPLIELQAETEKDYTLRLLPSLDMMKIKDKKDRGTITLKVWPLFSESSILIFCRIFQCQALPDSVLVGRIVHIVTKKLFSLPQLLFHLDGSCIAQALALECS